jgi:hypothetical protein
MGKMFAKRFTIKREKLEMVCFVSPELLLREVLYFG